MYDVVVSREVNIVDIFSSPGMMAQRETDCCEVAPKNIQSAPSFIPDRIKRSCQVR